MVCQQLAKQFLGKRYPEGLFKKSLSSASPNHLLLALNSLASRVRKQLNVPPTHKIARNRNCQHKLLSSSVTPGEPFVFQKKKSRKDYFAFSPQGYRWHTQKSFSFPIFHFKLLMGISRCHSVHHQCLSHPFH